MKLWKTEIIIWSEDNPKKLPLDALAKQAVVKKAYCAKRESEKFDRPELDSDWKDGSKHFDVSDYEPCCVVDQFCDAPANFDETEADSAKYVCYACGLPVCGKCSSIRTLRFSGTEEKPKQRLCNECQIEMDGNAETVVRRIYRMAGYKGKPT